MFSWGNSSTKNGKKNHSTSSTNQNSTSSRYTRHEHLSSYLTDAILKPSTRKVNDSTYDTVFQTKTKHALILRVHIPPSLTISAPKMTLVGIRAVHPWIDSRMKVIGYPPIENDATFLSSHMLLGHAVNAVVQHFQLNPPHALVIVDESLKRLQESLNGSVTGNTNENTNHQAHSNDYHHPMSNTSGTNASQNFGHTYQSARVSSSSQTPQESSPPPHEKEYTLPTHFTQVILMEDNDVRKRNQMLSQMNLPETPNTFPQYQQIDLPTMTSLLDNPQSLIPHLHDLPLITQIQSQKMSLLSTNATTAQSQMTAYSHPLSILHEEIISLQSSLKDKVDQVNQLQMKQMELCKPMDKNDILWRIKRAKKDSMDASEEIAAEWLAGDGGADEFLEKFLQSRVIHHVRAAKMERLENS